MDKHTFCEQAYSDMHHISDEIMKIEKHKMENPNAEIHPISDSMKLDFIVNYLLCKIHNKHEMYHNMMSHDAFKVSDVKLAVDNCFTKKVKHFEVNKLIDKMAVFSEHLKSHNLDLYNMLLDTLK